ncbi:MAG TPA: hypothetical protein VK212_02790 [Lentimicrobium sp.]|nr:hypothetical protein [Lentimicrobium sp.]
MKLIVILIILNLVMIAKGNNLYENLYQNENDTISATVKIIHIERIRYAYIVDVYDTIADSYYRIVFLKEKKQRPSIKIGQYHKIDFWPYYEEDMMPNHAIKNILIIKDKRIIIPSTGWSGNIYLTEDFKRKTSTSKHR